MKHRDEGEAAPCPRVESLGGVIQVRCGTSRDQLGGRAVVILLLAKQNRSVVHHPPAK
jgi:hypothetical protein